MESDLFGCGEGKVLGGGYYSRGGSVAVVCEQRKAFLRLKAGKRNPFATSVEKDCRCTRGFVLEKVVAWLPGLLGFLCDTWIGL